VTLIISASRAMPAEPLVVEGYQGIKAREAKIPLSRRDLLAEAAPRMVRLNEAWGKPEQAAAWKEKLGLADMYIAMFTLQLVIAVSGRPGARAKSSSPGTACHGWVEVVGHALAFRDLNDGTQERALRRGGRTSTRCRNRGPGRRGPGPRLGGRSS
jgi:hypothetical protein